MTVLRPHVPAWEEWDRGDRTLTDLCLGLDGLLGLVGDLSEQVSALVSRFEAAKAGLSEEAWPDAWRDCGLVLVEAQRAHLAKIFAPLAENPSPQTTATRL